MRFHICKKKRKILYIFSVFEERPTTSHGDLKSQPASQSFPPSEQPTPSSESSIEPIEHRLVPVLPQVSEHEHTVPGSVDETSQESPSTNNNWDQNVNSDKEMNI